MNNLFDNVPEGLFTLLAAKNKRIYFHALMVLRSCYQQELRIRRADLVAYMIHQMEDELYQWSVDAEGEEGPAADHAPAPDLALGRTTGSGPVSLVDDIALNTLSGRAHALIRRLTQTGWLEVVPDDTSLGEQLLVPEYVSLLLEAFERMVNPEEKPYNSYVYGTYSALKTANEEREYMFQALQSAYDNTRALLESLKGLLHNMHKFYQNLQKQTAVRDLLAEHFDEYQVTVAAKTYHPLKTVDSVHRFRPRILQILRDWLTDEEVLTQIAQSMSNTQSALNTQSIRNHQSAPAASDPRLASGSGAHAASGSVSGSASASVSDSGDQDRHGESRYAAIRMMQFILDSFESMDSLLREIDRRNTSYNRASVERIQYLLNTDRDLKGKLVAILRQVPKLERAHESKLAAAMADLPVFQVRTADPDALYTEKKKRVRGTPQPLNLKETTPVALFAAEAEQLMERANSILSDEQVIRFIRRQMSADGVLHSRDMKLLDMEDYLRTLVAVIKSDEASFPFDLEWDEAQHAVLVNGYRIPAMRFMKREVV